MWYKQIFKWLQKNKNWLTWHGMSNHPLRFLSSLTGIIAKKIIKHFDYVVGIQYFKTSVNYKLDMHMKECDWMLKKHGKLWIFSHQAISL